LLGTSSSRTFALSCCTLFFEGIKPVSQDGAAMSAEKGLRKYVDESLDAYVRRFPRRCRLSGAGCATQVCPSDRGLYLTGSTRAALSGINFTRYAAFPQRRIQTASCGLDALPSRLAWRGSSQGNPCLRMRDEIIDVGVSAACSARPPVACSPCTAGGFHSPSPAGRIEGGVVLGQ
jgi:hypothetical protein